MVSEQTLKEVAGRLVDRFHPYKIILLIYLKHIKHE
jgi:hypothetical protein